MAENLQLLKRRIKTSKNVSQIAKAMEMMSASKIKKAQKTVEGNKPYAKRLELLTSQLIKNAKENKFTHPYIDGNASQKKLLVVISPDRGLCGSLNTNLYKALLPLEDKNTTVVTIGKKAESFVVKSNFELLASFIMGTTIPSYSTVYELMRLIDELYKTEKVGTVDILYTEFKSFFLQTPVIHRVLPIDTTTLEENNGAYHIYEPGAHLLLASLLPQYLEAALYSALLEAHTSEQVARMVAMQNAKTNANEIATYLTLAYNKSRQERITNEILDLSNNQVAI
ncbi:MAG: ATP synthase F1 subunit gamma [Candidatus Levyibacteriota bacterium]